MANLLKMAMIDTIVRLHRQGWSNRRIARELRIDRDAVSRHIREALAKAKAAKVSVALEKTSHLWALQNQPGDTSTVDDIVVLFSATERG
jgi:transcriptional regulator